MVIDVEKINRDVLYDEVYKQVGKIHSIILLADNKLENMQYMPIDTTVEFDTSPRKLTSFGEATIGDFTGYFLSSNIEILMDLKEHLDNLHPHLDTLKRDAKKLTESYQVEDYLDLIELIRTFFREHGDDISELLAVIEYLREIDVIAPAIFFTYPQWSSTQISDRYLKISNEEEIESLVDQAGDIVSGLYSHGRPTYYDIKAELEADIADSVDPEHVQYISVPLKSILVRTSRRALLELATYFEKIRVCSEYILSKIQNLSDGTILENVQFLELLVKKSMEKTLSETTLWDFKEKFPVWQEPTSKNKEKFALKVSSYANNMGGILIAGISDDRRVLGIPDIEERVKQTKQLIDNKIENSNHGINIASISMKTDDGEKVSCLLILIPQNCEPTSVTKIDDSIVYPYRDSVETKYKSYNEIKAIKAKVIDNNFRFARELINFVYKNGIVG